MEEPGRLHDPQASRKRHRSDDITAASFRLTHSGPLDTSKNIRQRPTNPMSHQDNDPLPPTSTAPDNQVQPLEPLHPPIPNFSAISQAPPRSSPTPHTNGADPPGGIIYNIALPLPNPGRAHRFCQACDHINHVRRKLCTNCGAPKPSAVRNAVGVRSITEVESVAHRMPDGTIHPDYLHNPVMPGSVNSSQLDMQNRFSTSAYTQNDQRLQKPSEHSLHQARSLAMKCPGDDIPLLGNASKLGMPFSSAETHTSRRFRTGQALLCEPLINFNTFQNTDPRVQAAPVRPHYGNHVELNTNPPKMFRDHAAPDREQYPLPSMQGMPSQKLIHGGTDIFKPLDVGRNILE